MDVSFQPFLQEGLLISGEFLTVEIILGIKKLKACIMWGEIILPGAAFPIL